jgi:hypothetical protein
VQASGSVTHVFADGSLTVESEGRGWHCQRAVSCVIAPQVGDRVLITHVDNQSGYWRCWSGSIAGAELSVPGDLHIRSSGELSRAAGAARHG